MKKVSSTFFGISLKPTLRTACKSNLTSSYFRLFSNMSDFEVHLTAPNGVKYAQPTGLFINNEWVKSQKGEKITSINPTDEKEITSVYAATAEDVDIAVKAARTAFKTWREVPGTERGNLLYKLSQLTNQHKETLATIETWDNGKTYSDALGDIGECYETFKYYGGYADKVHGQVIDTGPKKLAYTIREPLGVCGQIIPWKYAPCARRLPLIIERAIAHL